MTEFNHTSIYRSKKAYDYGLAFLAFLIPLVRKGLPLFILGAAIVGMFYYVIAYRKIGKEKKDYIFLPYNLLSDGFLNIIKSRNTLLFMVCFFLCYLVSVFYSNNKEVAWNGVVLKSSFLYFPLLFSLTKWDIEKVKRVFNFFILGCFVNLILSYLFVIINGDGVLELGDFMSSNLSFSFHRSYIAMYVNMAIILNTIILLSDSFIETKRTIAFRWLLQLLFSLFVIMLSSRSGLLTWFISIGCIVIYIWVIQKGFVKSLVFISVVGLLFVSSINTLSKLGSRMDETVNTIASSNYDKNKNGKYTSTGIRVGIWKASLSVLESSPIFGLGVGDGKMELVREYEKRRMTNCFASNFNSHNQYLDTGLAIGGFGVIILCVIIFFSFINYGRLTIITFAIMGVVGGNLLVESMLERQEGAIFISWIIALIVSIRPILKSLK